MQETVLKYISFSHENLFDFYAKIKNIRHLYEFKKYKRFKNVKRGILAKNI